MGGEPQCWEASRAQSAAGSCSCGWQATTYGTFMCDCRHRNMHPVSRLGFQRTAVQQAHEPTIPECPVQEALLNSNKGMHAQ